MNDSNWIFVVVKAMNSYFMFFPHGIYIFNYFIL